MGFSQNTCAVLIYKQLVDSIENSKHLYYKMVKNTVFTVNIPFEGAIFIVNTVTGIIQKPVREM